MEDIINGLLWIALVVILVFGVAYLLDKLILKIVENDEDEDFGGVVHPPEVYIDENLLEDVDTINSIKQILEKQRIVASNSYTPLKDREPTMRTSTNDNTSHTLGVFTWDTNEGREIDNFQFTPSSSSGSFGNGGDFGGGGASSSWDSGSTDSSSSDSGSSND